LQFEENSQNPNMSIREAAFTDHFPSFPTMVTTTHDVRFSRQIGVGGSTPGARV